MPLFEVPEEDASISCAWGAAMLRAHEGESFLDAYDEEMQERYGVSGRDFIAAIAEIMEEGNDDAPRG